MRIRHIDYILTIEQEGSITAASKKLYVTQPSLSQTIKLIEKDLGAEIFDRRKTPIKLTSVGRKYIEAAQKIEEIEKELFKAIKSSQLKTVVEETEYSPNLWLGGQLE